VARAREEGRAARARCASMNQGRSGPEHARAAASGARHPPFARRDAEFRTRSELRRAEALGSPAGPPATSRVTSNHCAGQASGRTLGEVRVSACAAAAKDPRAPRCRKYAGSAAAVSRRRRGRRQRRRNLRNPDLLACRRARCLRDDRPGHGQERPAVLRVFWWLRTTPADGRCDAIPEGAAATDREASCLGSSPCGCCQPCSVRSH
jgi:hypothetical protein